MAKGSDNPFPSVLFVEGAAPSSPAATNFRLYYDSADHLLKWKNSAGTVSTIATGTSGLANAHGCRAGRASGNFSIGTNTLTAVAFTSEDVDTDTMHDNSTNPSRFTIPTISGVTTGLWSIKAAAYTDYAAAGNASDSEFRVNAAGNPASGTPIAFSRFVVSGGVGPVLLTTDYPFTAGDYVEWFVRAVGSSGAQNVLFEAGFSPILSIAFLGKIT